MVLDILNNCRMIDVVELKELGDNTLVVIVQCLKTSNELEEIVIGDRTLEGLRPIIPDEETPFIEITFDSYAVISIINESFDSGDKLEIDEYEGRHLRMFSNSSFIEYAKSVTFSYQVDEHILVHFGLICSNHLINVITKYEPEIRAIERNKYPT